MAAIFIIAAFFRIWRIDAVPPGLYPDEAMNGNNALYALKTGDLQVFYPENNGREGLFINIQALSIKIFGNEPWTLRLISALFGIATIAGIFYLARELFKDKFLPENSNVGMNLKARDIIALAAAFFMAVSFWHINFSRIGFRAIMAPFFLIWGIYFLLSSLNKTTTLNTARAQAKIIIFAVLGGLFYGLGFYSYIAYRAAPLLALAVFLFYWLQNKEWPVRRKILLCAFCFLFSAVIVAAPLGIYFLKSPSDFFGRSSQISVFSGEAPMKDFLINLGKTFGAFWFSGDANARHNLPGSPQLWRPIGILFALGLAAGVYSFAKSSAKSGFKMIYLLLWSWLIIFSLPVAFSSEGLPHALRSILMLPAAIIFSAYGFWLIISSSVSWLEKNADFFPENSGLKELRRIKFEFFLLAAVFLGAHIAAAYSNYFTLWVRLPETYFAFSVPYTDMAKWLNNQSKELPKYVIVNADGVLVSSPDDKKIRPLPMPSQTLMFLTDSWPAENQKKQNLNYVLPDELAAIDCSQACAIIMLESDSSLKSELKQNIDGLKLTVKPGFPVYYKNAEF